MNNFNTGNNFNTSSGFNANNNSINDLAPKKKDDKQKTKSKRGLGSLLRKSTTKEDISEENTEHTELDTTE